ncbi:phosphoadenylyl-sulfate reductase [Rhizobiaceae bacterium]|nr:phosphoadenylyl-sulfate reductase [Rhizobiaceae bacterium]
MTLTAIASRAGTASLDWLERSSIDLLHAAFDDHGPGRVAVVSSFGAESAVLLHLVSQVDRSVPILFVNTRMLFVETLAYQRELADELGFTDIRIVTADRAALRAPDPTLSLHASDPDACCALRKTAPLNAALDGFEAWVNGRKRHQTTGRNAMAPVETDAAGRTKLNPLLHWTADDIEAAFHRHDLPRHPLVGEGYTSLGCAPCTAKPAPGGDDRSGRWAGLAKTECGIHVENGRIVRASAEAVL